jgi:hypothetical protein
VIALARRPERFLNLVYWLLAGEAPPARRADIDEELAQFHRDYMASVTPAPLIFDDDGGGVRPPSWWQGDEDALAVTKAGVQTRAEATTQRPPRARRSPG